MFRQTFAAGSVLCCSFCHKGQQTAGKLIASPSDYPRAYICDECIAVCNMIIEDELGQPEHLSTPEMDAVLGHPRGPDLVQALQAWADREASEVESSNELAEVRRLALEIFGHNAQGRT